MEPIGRRTAQYVVGPTVTLATMLGVELLSRFGLQIPNPAVVYYLTLVFAAFYGGIPGGVVSAAIILGYMSLFFSIPGHPFSYSPENLQRIAVLWVTTPLIALMVSVLKHRLVQQTRELERAVIDLQHLATTDSLTQLSNRRVLLERLHEEIVRIRRNGQSLSLIMMDVDGFKRHNDSFGHAAGDEVLRRLADVLRSSARESDLVARYGGEEFAVLAPDTDKQGAIYMAERLRRALEQSAWPTGPVTASFGAATLLLSDAVDGTAETLIAEADRALYVSKMRGRNTVAHASDIALVEEPFQSQDAGPRAA
jgi:diguanylate cyclase (GGDEF)-like protein